MMWKIRNISGHFSSSFYGHHINVNFTYFTYVQFLSLHLDTATENDKTQPPESAITHHVLVCALQELGCLVLSLGTSSAPLVSEPAAGK